MMSILGAALISAHCEPLIDTCDCAAKAVFRRVVGLVHAHDSNRIGSQA
jgi:hypothetical protein